MAEDEYTVKIAVAAAKQLAKIAGADRSRITAAIESLAHDPRPTGCIKLTGFDAYRIRVGNYRVVYEIEDDVRIVQVDNIGHRREIYRRM